MELLDARNPGAGTPNPTPIHEALVAEFRRYLASDIANIVDPIAWWYANASAFPHLWRMAVDYLSIPGTSPTPLTSRRFLSA